MIRFPRIFKKRFPNRVSFRKALKEETIHPETFYAAITGKDRHNEKPMLKFGEIHPFEFTEKNRDKIYELVKKIRRHYEKYYKPEENKRKYYESHLDEIDKAYESGSFKEQKKAIESLLIATVLD